MSKIIIADTREKKNKHILDYFEKNNQDYIISNFKARHRRLYVLQRLFHDH